MSTVREKGQETITPKVQRKQRKENGWGVQSNKWKHKEVEPA
uniref:Uncharacterized protein n=1 Tax=Anguilla anguilla TaxID=7936 RepID=A0A0E9QNC1_ANGAN